MHAGRQRIMNKKWASVEQLDVAWKQAVTGRFGPEGDYR